MQNYNLQNDDASKMKSADTSFARPYIKIQKFTKMYKLPTSLKKGTIFPELFLLDSPIYNKDLYSTPLKQKGGNKHD